VLAGFEGPVPPSGHLHCACVHCHRARPRRWRAARTLTWSRLAWLTLFWSRYQRGRYRGLAVRQVQTLHGDSAAGKLPARAPRPGPICTRVPPAHERVATPGTGRWSPAVRPAGYTTSFGEGSGRAAHRTPRAPAAGILVALRFCTACRPPRPVCRPMLAVGRPSRCPRSADAVAVPGSARRPSMLNSSDRRHHDAGPLRVAQLSSCSRSWRASTPSSPSRYGPHRRRAGGRHRVGHAARHVIGVHHNVVSTPRASTWASEMRRVPPFPGPVSRSVHLVNACAGCPRATPYRRWASSWLRREAGDVGLPCRRDRAPPCFAASPSPSVGALPRHWTMPRRADSIAVS